MQRVIVVSNDASMPTRLAEWQTVAGDALGTVDFSLVCIEPAPKFETFSGAQAVIVDGRADVLLAIAECGRLLRTRRALGLVAVREISPQTRARVGVKAVLPEPCEAEALRGFFRQLFADGDTPEASLRPGRCELGAVAYVDRRRRSLVVDSHEVSLSSQKFDLLCYLIDHAGTAVTASDLVREGILRPSQTQRFRGLILELRDRLGPSRHVIRAVPGYGYRLELHPPAATTDTLATRDD